MCAFPGKIMGVLTGRIAATVPFLFSLVSVVSAADLKVLSTIGVQSALEELTPQFEKASGNKLHITWGTAAMMVKLVEGGESADLYVLTRQGLDALVKEGKAEPGAAFASSGIAMVVKKDAPKPDISTAEKFKQALLNARAIAYSNPTAGGASGVYIANLIEKMGIAEQLRGKTRHPPAGGNSADLVVRGEAELALQQEPEVISVPGVELVGPLPVELNNVTFYAAGPAVDSKNLDAARALIAFLRSSQAQTVFKARGLKPE